MLATVAEPLSVPFASEAEIWSKPPLKSATPLCLTAKPTCE